MALKAIQKLPGLYANLPLTPTPLIPKPTPVPTP